MRNMSREELNNVLKLHEKWLVGDKDGIRANLGYANLKDADLRGTDLRGANLMDTDLRGANLMDTDLRNANLMDTDLRGANLMDTDLRNANLRNANLRGANLRNANLMDTDLRIANLMDADLDHASLPLCCGSLRANMDDRQIIQLLYHVLSITKYSTNISDAMKKLLLTENNLNIANQFHRVDECGKL